MVKIKGREFGADWVIFVAMEGKTLGAVDSPCLNRVFPGPFTHGGICPPPIWGDKVLMGGTHEGYTDLMGGPNFDRLYHKLKVLLMLSCNYTMQFIGYDSIKTH